MAWTEEGLLTDALILQEGNMRNIVNSPFKFYSSFSVSIIVLSEHASLDVLIHS